MRGLIKYFVVALLTLFVCGEVSAQQMKERGLVRKGNRQFKREQFEKSVDSYQRALQHDSTSFVARWRTTSEIRSLHSRNIRRHCHRIVRRCVAIRMMKMRSSTTPSPSD